MTAYLLVTLGGGLGAVCRFGLSRLVQALLGGAFPWGTMVVNVFGCFVMGMVGFWFLNRGTAEGHLRLFLTTGFLGGFTTFSAFAWDMTTLMDRQAMAAALVYVLASVLLSLLAVLAGVALAKTVLT